MRNLKELQKQQVGLRLPRYLIDDIDEFTQNFSLNRSEVIVEAIKSYIKEQKLNNFYEQFDDSCQQISSHLSEPQQTNTKLQTLDELIDELEHN